ncbi:MAG TPA: beta-galactosidase [Candidatus Paceibacterota bacterium]|nr:beta-galactosidase [Candidatus Paceibacterota bacterium]
MNLTSRRLGVLGHLAVGLWIVGAAAALVWILQEREEARTITYGVSFSVPYAEEIGIDWKAAYRAMLDDLGVRHVRLSAYWNTIEPQRDRYDWSDLDYQIREAAARDADIILAVGRRLPRWPECHAPAWAQEMEWEAQKDEILEYMTDVIERYRNEPAIVYWQVENEPFLKVFGREACGKLDEVFLREQIALVRALDSRPVLLTDGGNFGLWMGAYRFGDAFGTSMYLYFWRPDIGAFRTILPPAYYRIKANLMEMAFGVKPVILTELSLEPWLAAHINDVPLQEQIARMSIAHVEEIIAYARASTFDRQYLWGIEWWYYMRERGQTEYWELVRPLFVAQ